MVNDGLREGTSLLERGLSGSMVPGTTEQVPQNGGEIQKYPAA